MSKTIQQLAQEAIDVQDACNLIAVLHGYARAMSCLNEIVKGTDATRLHPIAQAWADKVASLTGTQSLGADVAMKAHGECTKLARGE